MSDYTSWKVGDKVECVDGVFDYSSDDRYKDPMPSEGVVYTISDLEMLDAGARKGRLLVDEDTLFISLDELDPLAWFDAAQFRPVQTRKTDISIFTAMLPPSPKQRERV